MQWFLSNVTHNWLTWHGAHNDRWFTRTFRYLSSEPLLAAACCLAARVAHSTVTHSSEEPTLAEGTEITTHIAGRFTVSPQGKAVSRRRRAFLHTKFVLRRRESEREAGMIHGITLLGQSSACGGAASKVRRAIRIKIQSKCNSRVWAQEIMQVQWGHILNLSYCLPLSWKSRPSHDRVTVAPNVLLKEAKTLRCWIEATTLDCAHMAHQGPQGFNLRKHVTTTYL